MNREIGSGANPPAPRTDRFRRIWNRVFPEMPDFFGLLADQSRHAAEVVALFAEFMATGREDLGLAVRREEHEADRAKAANIATLNGSFATPIDREDIYRAIVDLDEVVNYCKTAVREMEVLAVEPDPHLHEMALILQEGVNGLAFGFETLGDATTALGHAQTAIKAERRIEKAYRAALAELFQGDDYLGMFKRREVYRHMSNAGDRLSGVAHTLSDIIVKMG